MRLTLQLNKEKANKAFDALQDLFGECGEGESLSWSVCHHKNGSVLFVLGSIMEIGSKDLWSSGTPLALFHEDEVKS